LISSSISSSLSAKRSRRHCHCHCRVADFEPEGLLITLIPGDSMILESARPREVVRSALSASRNLGRFYIQVNVHRQINRLDLVDSSIFVRRKDRAVRLDLAKSTTVSSENPPPPPPENFGVNKNPNGRSQSPLSICRPTRVTFAQLARMIDRSSYRPTIAAIEMRDSTRLSREGGEGAAGITGRITR